MRKRMASLLIVVLAAHSASATDEPQLLESATDAGPRGAASVDEDEGVKTLGGRQFWGDVTYFRGWRIQRNVLTGHFRLLDEADERHASGSLDKCLAALDAVKNRQQLPPMSGRAVILIHGIIRSSKSFSALKRELEAEGAIVVPFDYPSTRVSIADSAEFLNAVIHSLEGIERIDFVVHSMGGLVLRAYLQEHADPRIGRLVMLGVPNLGAKMANLVKDVGLYKLLFGPAGQQLIEDDQGFIASLPTPDFPFAVIAGARGTENGFNPLIPGDDDGTVSVAATRLPGAADFMTVPVLHSFLMGNAEVISATCRFLDTGVLREQGEAQSISREEGQDSR